MCRMQVKLVVYSLSNDSIETPCPRCLHDVTLILNCLQLHWCKASLLQVREKEREGEIGRGRERNINMVLSRNILS
jgi:hypothetical protein